jgi:RimJ/RimL family protein N-acetyltransferase
MVGWLSKAGLLHGADQVVAKWVSDRCKNVHYGFVSGNYKATGVVLDDQIIAGFVFTDWQPQFGTMEMSLASDSPRWGSRRIIHELLAYPFIERECQRITVITSENNTKALRLADGVGFERESVVKRAYGLNENAILLRLFKEDWQVGKYGMRV